MRSLSGHLGVLGLELLCQSCRVRAGLVFMGRGSPICMCCPYIAGMGSDASDRTVPREVVCVLGVLGDGYDRIKIM